MTTRSLSLVIAAAIAATSFAGIASPASAQGQFSFGISANKNSKDGKALLLADTILAGGSPFMGKGNHTKIGQHGNGNSAGVVQHCGNGNTVAVQQFGNNHSTNVDQCGNNDTLGVLQVGDGTSSTVHQTGNNQVGLQIDAGF
jgi:Curlin associated repeat